MVEYRQAKPTDLKALLPLVEAFARDQEAQLKVNTLSDRFMEFARGGVAQALEHPAGCVMVAEEQQEERRTIIGYAVGMAQEPPPAFETEMYTYITDLYVSPDFRRQGIGKALVERIRGWGWVNGINRVSLVVPAGSPAQELCTRLGFKPIQAMMYHCDQP